MLIKGLAKFQWRNIRFLFEQFIEGLRMFKSEFVGNFSDRQRRIGQDIFGFFDQLIVNMLLGTVTCERF